MMSELSIAQKQYILSQKKHRRTVRIGRSSICILFLLLWEFTADAGIIDSFVFSSPSKIVTCFISMLKDGSILLHQGFEDVDTDKIKLIQTLGGNRWHILTKVLLPANVPRLLSLAKVNIGLCLVGVIIGEFISSKCGLGYLIIYASQVFKMDWMLMSIVILCMISMGLYGLIGFAEKWYQKRMG